MIGRALQQGREQYNPGGDRGRMPGGNRGPRGPVKPTAPSRFGQGMKKLGQQGGMASMIRRAREQRNPTTGGPGGPVLRPSPGRTPMTGGPSGPAGQQALMKAKMQQMQQRGGGGGIMRPAVQPPQRGPGTVAGKPRPGAGTFGFASQRGAAPAMPGPAALAQPRGQTMAQRIGGRQGPPARAGGMARALGSGGSRRRLLR